MMRSFYDCDEIEVNNEEIVTHHVRKLRNGKWRVELRVLGRLTIDGEEFHWNKVLEVPLHPITEAADDDFYLQGREVSDA